MAGKKAFNRLVIPFYFLLGFFSFPHLIDDFLYGIPEEFGLDVKIAQVLTGFFFVLYGLILMMLAMNQRRGRYLAIIMGGFLALAGILKHVPLMLNPGPYWGGWFSEGLILGMILAGIGLVIAATFDLKRN